MVATWTAGITAAAGTCLTQSLFLRRFGAKKSFLCTESTLAHFITLSCIVKYSQLQHSVELGIVSQIPSPGYSAKSPH